jgi:outer membrane receptor protein involved in Fe transport
MKSLLLASLSLLCLLTGTQAQTIQGTVLDDKGTAITDATVSLLKAADSSWQRSDLTNGEGHYSLNADAGEYLLQIAGTGYNTQTKSIRLEKDRPLTLDFKLASNTLEGVTVTSKKPFIEARPGMMVVNIENNATSAGNNALELLQRSPGVQVDPQGNVSMRGKSGVVVYVDGRPSRLSGDQLTAYLRSMTAEEIAQLELITQPSAKYEAAGTSGIINIRTRSIRKQGINGNLSSTLTQATNSNGNLSGRLTYKHNKLTLYASEYFNYVNNHNTLQVDRRYLDPQSQEVTGDVQTDQTLQYRSHFHRIKAGAEYALSSKTTIGIRAQMPIGHPQMDYKNITTIQDYPSSTTSYNVGTRSMDNHWYEKEVGLLGKHQFRDNSELSFDGFYVVNHGGDHGLFINTPTNGNGQAVGAPDLWDITFPVDIQLLSAQSDYSRALGKKTKLETGAKFTDVHIDYSSRFLIPDGNGVFILDTTRNSRFLYHESVAAAYANVTRTINDRIEAQAGLRAEQTNTHGDVVGTSTSFTRSYLSFFPTLFASYKADSNNSFTFSYGRRLDRPNYYILNPAKDYIDKYSYRVGNPSLRPQFNNNFEAGYSYKGELTVTLSFMQTNGVISDFFVQDDQTKTAYEVHDNIAGYRQGGISVNYNKTLRPWWTSNIYGDYYLKEYHGNYYGTDYRSAGHAYSFNVSNQFKLGRGWNAELSGWYNGPGLETVFTRPAEMGSIDVAVSKKLLSDSLVIKLAANDVLGTQRYRGNSRFANFDTDVTSTWDARRAVLSLNYSFGKSIELMQRKGDAERRNM